MARLIDVRKLKPSEVYMNYGFTRIVYMDDIDELPSVDAVEVVRCKDCRYCVPFRNRPSGMCERKYEWYDVVENIQECFCSWGERREDEAKQDD